HLQNAVVFPRRVVVLGATGFVGSELVRQLRHQQVETVALGSADIDLARADAGTALARILRETDTLVFGAALTPEKGNDCATLMRNLKMAEGLASIEGAQCNQLIYISSDAVYANSDALIGPAIRPAPGTLYGHMHLCREQMVADVALRWDCP